MQQPVCANAEASFPAISAEKYPKKVPHSQWEKISLCRTIGFNLLSIFHCAFLISGLKKWSRSFILIFIFHARQKLREKIRNAGARNSSHAKAYHFLVKTSGDCKSIMQFNCAQAKMKILLLLAVFFL